MKKNQKLKLNKITISVLNQQQIQGGFIEQITKLLVPEETAKCLVKFSRPTHCLNH